MPSKFAIRLDQPEIMDDLNYQGSEMDKALAELETINKWLGGDSVTVTGINRLLNHLDTEPSISIADMGCGGGDMLIKIARWGRDRGIKLKLTGIDANPYIVDYARVNTRDYPEIKYQTMNVFHRDLHCQQFDIITSTLFTHHFQKQELAKLITQWGRQSRLGVVINDLHRHWLAYYSIVGLTKLFSRSYMVKNDGPISVLRGFKKTDWKQLLEQLNIQRYYLRWCWAFRWQLIIPSDQNLP